MILRGAATCHLIISSSTDSWSILVGNVPPALPPRRFLYDTYSCSPVQILKELHKSCQKEDGTDDQKKGTQLLEVYAIEIQMYTETKNNKKLKVTSTWTFNAIRLL